MGGNVSWLTTVPATDMNFKNHLRYATVGEIKEALLILSAKGEKGNKSRVSALSRELRRRGEGLREGDGHGRGIQK